MSPTRTDDSRGDCKIQKSKPQNKRKGNNVYGSRGMTKCGACRKARRKCHFDHAEDPCFECVKRGLPCHKSRRGGSQYTVRISVLQKLDEEHPGWTLKDALAHLNGNPDVPVQRVRSCPLDDGYASATSPDEAMQYVRFVKVESEPLSMELSLPDNLDVYSSTVSTPPSPSPTPSLMDLFMASPPADPVKAEPGTPPSSPVSVLMDAFASQKPFSHFDEAWPQADITSSAQRPNVQQGPTIAPSLLFSPFDPTSPLALPSSVLPFMTNANRSGP